jgi:single-strand DNA-binding protein
MNDVTFVGNTMGEPELRFTASGRPVVNLPLAVNRSYTKASGEKVETMTKYQVSVWGDQAENIAESVPKGARVIVTGYLEMEDWVDRDGNTRTTPRITASEVALSLRWARVGQVSKVSGGSGGASAPSAAPDQGHFGTPPSAADIPF